MLPQTEPRLRAREGAFSWPVTDQMDSECEGSEDPGCPARVRTILPRPTPYGISTCVPVVGPSEGPNKHSRSDTRDTSSTSLPKRLLTVPEVRLTVPVIGPRKWGFSRCPPHEVLRRQAAGAVTGRQRPDEHGIKEAPPGGPGGARGSVTQTAEKLAPPRASLTASRRSVVHIGRKWQQKARPERSGPAKPLPIGREQIAAPSD
jgi:hypothetical protein